MSRYWSISLIFLLIVAEFAYLHMVFDPFGRLFICFCLFVFSQIREKAIYFHFPITIYWHGYHYSTTWIWYFVKIQAVVDETVYLCPLFHWSTYLFLRQYQAALVPMTLQYNLKLSVLIHLCINFKMTLSIQVFVL